MFPRRHELTHGVPQMSSIIFFESLKMLCTTSIAAAAAAARCCYCCTARPFTGATLTKKVRFSKNLGVESQSSRGQPGTREPNFRSLFQSQRKEPPWLASSNTHAANTKKKYQRNGQQARKAPYFPLQPHKVEGKPKKQTKREAPVPAPPALYPLLRYILSVVGAYRFLPRNQGFLPPEVLVPAPEGPLDPFGGIVPLEGAFPQPRSCVFLR